MASLSYHSSYPQMFDTSVASKSLEWYSSDSKEFYSNNLKKLQNWRWSGVSIKYEFNSFGYRSKEVDQLDKDFILTFGCSFTEGTGLHNYQTWPHKLAELLKIDYYNAGKSGTGLDVIYYNSLLWKQHKLPLPKQVIVQWPEANRKSWGTYNNNEISLDVSNGKEDDWWKYYITSDGEIHMNNIAWYLGFNNVWQSLGVPVLNITWCPFDHLQNLEFPLHYSDIKNDLTLLARDHMHSGPEFQNNIAKMCKRLLDD